MYLVSPKVLQRYKDAVEPRESVKTKKMRRRKISPQSDYKWIKMSEKFREEFVTCKAQLKDIVNFMEIVLPEKRHNSQSPEI